MVAVLGLIESVANFKGSLRSSRFECPNSNIENTISQGLAPNYLT